MYDLSTEYPYTAAFDTREKTEDEFGPRRQLVVFRGRTPEAVQAAAVGLMGLWAGSKFILWISENEVEVRAEETMYRREGGTLALRDALISLKAVVRSATYAANQLDTILEIRAYLAEDECQRIAERVLKEARSTTQRLAESRYVYGEGFREFMTLLQAERDEAKRVVELANTMLAEEHTDD